MIKFMKRFSQAYHDMVEAEALMDQVMAERNQLQMRLADLEQTAMAEIAALNCECRILRDDNLKLHQRNAALEEDNYELKEQVMGLANQMYNYAGSPLEDEPIASEDGAEIVCFSSRLAQKRTTRH
jgi:hypothetical protein